VGAEPALPVDEAGGPLLPHATQTIAIRKAFMDA
jgi:hypothetical protein